MLVIAIDEYEHLPPLFNCVKDVQDFIELLTGEYLFAVKDVHTLYDREANKENITNAFYELARLVTPQDNVVIYFSGHGELDPVLKRGYWIPVEAQQGRIHQYLPNSEVRDFLNAISSRHTFLIADSCFSGSLFASQGRGKYAMRRSEKDPSRWGLTSGREEIVSDGKPGDNSPFAESLLFQLRGNQGSMPVDELCARVREYVETNSNQTPIGQPLKVEGHKNGTFYFHRQQRASDEWAAAQAANTALAYAQFAAKHPESPHAEEAWWQRALLLESVEGYDDYLYRCPSGYFAIQALEALALTEEDAFWRAAQLRDSLVEYRKYLGKYPSGRYLTQAMARIGEMRGNASLSSMTPPAKASSAPQSEPELPFPLPEMIFVQGGPFTMGWKKERDGEGYDAEKPAHSVTIKDFYLGRKAVTVADFKVFTEDSKYKTEAEKQGSSTIWTGGEYKDGKGVNWRCDVSGKVRPESESDHPVLHVSWNDAQAYCQWLAQKTNQPYRLPTEAEWEYASRGGRESKGFKYAGSNNLDEVAWCSSNSGGKTHPVGTKKANELGLYDMIGNVWEWCEDDWHSNYNGAPKDGSAWVDSHRASYRVYRGGSWNSTALNCRASFRFCDALSYRGNRLGFRLAL